jgi:hypothetical protein
MWGYEGCGKWAGCERRGGVRNPVYSYPYGDILCTLGVNRLFITSPPPTPPRRDTVGPGLGYIINRGGVNDQLEKSSPFRPSCNWLFYYSGAVRNISELELSRSRNEKAEGI